MSFKEKRRVLASKVKEDIHDEHRDTKKYASRAKEFPSHRKEFVALSHEEAGHARRLARLH